MCFVPVAVAQVSTCNGTDIAGMARSGVKRGFEVKLG